MCFLNFICGIINGKIYEFFNPSKGVEPTCSLSLYSFLLVVKGLSGSLAYARRISSLQGIKVGYRGVLTYILFVNDVLLFYFSSGNKMVFFRDLLLFFRQVTRMEFNDFKSALYNSSLEGEEITLAQYFPFLFLNSIDNVKYLGFYMKPNN